MAGKKQFVYDDVVRHATELFRQRGYAASSIDDLVQATGVARSSLYSTFGNKEELFALVFSRYCAEMMARLVPNKHLQPGVALRQFLFDLLDTLEGWGTLGGCLVTNTCLEYSHIPPAIRSICDAGLADQEVQLQEFFVLARSHGELPATADAGGLAAFFVALRQSIGLLWKAGQPREKIAAVIEASLAVIPPPSQKPAHRR